MEDFSVLYKFYDEYNGADFIDAYNFFNKCVERFSHIKPNIVLDLGCGTGELTKLLSENYQVIGVDLSADMLSIAANKNIKNALWLNQDMRRLDLFGTIQGVICFCDCLNYIKTRSDIAKVFLRVSLFLEEGGLFIFDASTKHRFCNILSNTSFVNETEDGMLIHQGEYSEEHKTIDMFVTIFSKYIDGTYKRYDEHQKEYYHSDSEFLKVAEETGFELCGIFGDMNFKRAHTTDEKHYFVFRRKLWEI